MFCLDRHRVHVEEKCIYFLLLPMLPPSFQLTYGITAYNATQQTPREGVRSVSMSQDIRTIVIF